MDSDETLPPVDRDDTIIRLLCELRSEVQNLSQAVQELRALNDDIQRRLRLIAGF